MTILQKLGIEGVLAVLVPLMAWFVQRALRRGYVKVDPLFFIDGVVLFDLTVKRAALPIVYWPIVLLMMAIALALLSCMVAVALVGLV